MGWPDALNFFGVNPPRSCTDFSNQDAPDSNTLMIVAGPCGSGKSNLLQVAYREKLPLFGPDSPSASASRVGIVAIESMMITRLFGIRNLFFRPVM